MKARRVTGVYKRHFYVVLRSFPRILDMTLWPFVDLLLWGMVTVYLRHQQVHLATPLGFLLGGLLLGARRQRITRKQSDRYANVKSRFHTHLVISS